ncbi:hypothetical protein BJX64DRAFT_261021 [Aspergillus heterothallicus]
MALPFEPRHYGKDFNEIEDPGNVNRRQLAFRKRYTRFNGGCMHGWSLMMVADRSRHLERTQSSNTPRPTLFWLLCRMLEHHNLWSALNLASAHIKKFFLLFTRVRFWEPRPSIKHPETSGLCHTSSAPSDHPDNNLKGPTNSRKRSKTGVRTFWKALLILPGPVLVKEK